MASLVIELFCVNRRANIFRIPCLKAQVFAALGCFLHFAENDLIRSKGPEGACLTHNPKAGVEGKYESLQAFSLETHILISLG